jgi:hypothetical protein
MGRSIFQIVLRVLFAGTVVASSAQAQSEIGTVAAIAGKLQVRHGAIWQAGTIGGPVFAGDRLRTGAPDRAKIVFADDSVLDVGPDTDVTLDTQVFEPTAHRFRSLLHLGKGKVRAWVSDYYREPRARYEVETPTAIAGVRGTEFIAVYNPASEVTDIVGIEDQVEVVGKLAMIGRAVQVGPQLCTIVQKGRFPTAPHHLSDAEFQGYLEGLDIVGTGRRDGLNVLHAATAGRVLTSQDVPPPPAALAAGLSIAAPQMFLADVLSVYTNTQPLLQYQQLNATGSVQVGF